MGTLTLEDGTTLEVPDGATSDQVLAIVNERSRQTELATQRERARISYSMMPTHQRVWTGFARPFLETGLGIKDLAGKAGVGDGLSDEDRITLERVEQIDGGAGTVGRVAGEIGLLAGPGGIAAKGATLLPRALARFAPRVTTDIAASAGMEALKAPTESTSRGERAAWGAAGAGAGHALTSTLAAAVRGLRPTTQAAIDMLSKGIPLTPGMIKGGVMQEVEQHLAKVPLVGGAIRRRQQEALGTWNQSLLNSVAPEDQVTASGHEGMRQTTNAFKSAYEKLWSKPIAVSLPELEKLWWSTIDESQRKLPPEISNLVNDKLYRVFTDTLATAPSKAQGAAISFADDLLRSERAKAARAGMSDVASLLGQARQQLRSVLPKDVSDELTRVDELYAQFARLRRAASYKGAAANEGVFTPDQLLGAATALDKSAGKNATAQGKALMQPEATAAQQVIGSVGGKPPGTLERAALGAASVAAAPVTIPTRAAYSALGVRAMAGQTAPQRWMYDTYSNSDLRALVDALRRHGVTGGTVGAAVENE